MWTPSEIIINNKVINDPVTRSFIDQCPGVPVQYVNSGESEDIVAASQRLTAVAPTAAVLNKIIAGKQVVYIGPAGKAVDKFNIEDDRLLCPHFWRVKFASNGCYYQCDWCYLKGTFRAQAPFIRVYAQYEEIKKQLLERLGKLQESDAPILFNGGELADSVSLDHLMGAAAEFIPFFGQQEKGYLFMLTKSDNVDHLRNLPHNGHTIIAWSLNAPSVSAQYEIGAPNFQQRLDAALKVQQAGYRLRVRLDPIVPVNGWKQLYAATIAQIFQKIDPERITLGTLRFEEQFWKMRDTIVSDSSGLKAFMVRERMKPMFEPKVFKKPKKKKDGTVSKPRPSIGKYSFVDKERIAIFRFVIDEIRKYRPEIPVALCKESLFVWGALGPLGLDPSRCQCVCQLDYADVSGTPSGLAVP